MRSPARVSEIGYLGDISVYKVRLDNGLVHEGRGRQPRTRWSSGRSGAATGSG